MFKKYLKKLLKVLLGLLVITVVTFLIALWWPLPDFEVPITHPEIAIHNVTIVDVESGNLHKAKTVYVKNNRIVKIDTSLMSGYSGKVIQGEGKYLIPGLWEMHGHSVAYSEWLHHPLFIAHGVTAVRDMSGHLDRGDSYWKGAKDRLSWNDEMQENQRVSPRFIGQSSYQMNGDNSVPEGYPDYFKLESESDAARVLEYYKDQQVDFIKIYSEIPREGFMGLAQQAPQYNIHLAGHKPFQVNITEAANAGLRSFEHGRMFMMECAPISNDTLSTGNFRAIYRESIRLQDQLDDEKVKSLMHVLKEQNAYWTPTLQTVKSDAYGHLDSFRDNSNLKYAPYFVKKFWWGPALNSVAQKNSHPERAAQMASYYRRIQNQITQAQKIGVPILAGTDVTDVNSFAGPSLHTELQDLVNGGLTPLQALQAATINAVKFSKMEEEYGTIAQGKYADMLLLDNNPLEDIKNTETINAVFLNGVYYDAEKIKQLKQTTADVAGSFHINVKVIHSLFSSPLVRRQLAD